MELYMREPKQFYFYFYKKVITENEIRAAYFADG